MKNCVRSKALMACAVAGLVLGLSCQTASAADRDMVRSAQMKLSDLGYFSDMYDGKIGPVTAKAIRNFQHQNKLPVSGKLTPRTYDLLVTLDDKQKHGKEAAVAAKATDSAPLPETWHFVISQKLAVRTGDLVVEEEAKDTLHRFTVKFNGAPFLLADNQPGAFQISEVFQLKGEDAMIMTAFRGEEGCTYKNYLVTVPTNDRPATKYEFESCAPSSEVHEAFGALFVRFAGTMNKDGYASWDVWRYENFKLVRL
jgi:hypothetical protein